MVERVKFTIIYIKVVQSGLCVSLVKQVISLFTRYKGEDIARFDWSELARFTWYTK